MNGKRDYLNRFHSDQMVLEIVRWEVKPKATQGVPSCSSPLRSDGPHDGQGGGWTALRRWPKTLKTMPNSRGSTRLESTEIRGSHGS